MTFPPRTTSLAATATAAAASAIAYPFLPRRVATHFDADGQADRYSSRAAAALTLPAVMTAFTVVNRRLGGWPGSKDREDSASGAQTRDEAIGLIEVALLPAHLAVLANGIGVPVDTSRIPRVVYGVLMIALGNVMPKLPRNGIIGIRTPWTLADPVVWERTHRLGGYLVTASGLVTLVSLPAGGKRAERLSSAPILGAVGLSAVYSFILYRRRHRSNR
jgi:immunity protein, SdpI family